jgi:RNA polymerase sigma-70 factor (ECF subfamily)
MTATAAQDGRFSFDEDYACVERCLRGDPRAFDELFSRYRERVYVIAKGILLDHDDALDSVQEAFTLIYRSLGRFNRRSKLGTWIFRIAVNTAIQRSRRLKHRSRLTHLDEALEAPAADLLEASDDADRVAQTLACMRHEDRALLTLFYWEDLSLAEIGEAIGCSANAAKTRLYRARERFRTIFEGGQAE